MSENPNDLSYREFGELQATLADGESIDSGWIDMTTWSKYELAYGSDVVLDLVIESRFADSGGALLSTPATYNGVFYFATLSPREDWMRFILTNNTGGDATNARMTVRPVFGGVEGASVFPASIPPSTFSPATLTQSFNIGLDANGNPVNQRMNSLGASITADFGTELARGVYPNQSYLRKFGRNPDIDTTSDPQDVCYSQANYTGFNATANENIAVAAGAADLGTLVSSGTATGGSATTLIDSGATFISDGVAVDDAVLNDTQGIYGFVRSVDSETQVTLYQWIDSDESEYSTAVSDAYRIATAGSTGAAVIMLRQLMNIDRERQANAFVILNQGSTVTLTGDYARCSTAEVILAGSGETNANDITINQATTTANVFVVIQAGLGRSTVGAFTIGANESAILKKAKVSLVRASGAAGSATVLLLVRELGSSVFTARDVFEVSTSKESKNDFFGGIVLNSGCDVKFRVLQVSDNDTIAEASAELTIYEE